MSLRFSRRAPRIVFAFLVVAVCALGLAPAAKATTFNDEGKASVVLYDNGEGSLGGGAKGATSKLDVHEGEVRVGDSGAACTKTNEGAIRYARPDLEFCDGADWLAVNVTKRTR